VAHALVRTPVSGQYWDVHKSVNAGYGRGDGHDWPHPYRPVLALLTHTVPTSDSGVEVFIGVGVQDLDLR